MEIGIDAEFGEIEGTRCAIRPEMKADIARQPVEFGDHCRAFELA
jgi:hypothetical protein